jgi:long-chain acyl-CoA synthetase
MSLELDLGMDSLRWMTFALRIEEKIGIHLDETAMQRITTVRDLLREVVAAPAIRNGNNVEGLGSPPVAAGGGAILLRICVFAVLALIARLYFHLRVEGRENIPRTGPIVLAANHASDLDPGFLAAAVPVGLRRRLRWGGDVGRLFVSPFVSWISRVMGIFPVDERRPLAALDAAASVLRSGAVLPWFPESWRSPDGTIQQFLPGIGKLLLDTDVPVLPVYIAGAFDALPRGKRWPRPVTVTVKFGRPLRVKDLIPMYAGAGQSSDDLAGQVADALRAEVIRLAKGV